MNFIFAVFFKMATKHRLRFILPILFFFFKWQMAIHCIVNIFPQWYPHRTVLACNGADRRRGEITNVFFF